MKPKSDHRLLAVDLLRGSLLSIIIIDHIDIFALESGIFRRWTLMGLGFSDAAEAFTFLSGFTFAWAYDSRMDRCGFPSCQWRALVRTVQIYGSYLVTASAVAALAFASGHPSWFSHEADLRTFLLDLVRLEYQPIALGILCMYIVCIPFLPTFLVLCRRAWWAAAATSGLLYIVAQGQSQYATLWVGRFAFNPMAWQTLIVAGMVCGHRARLGRRITRKSTFWVILSAVMLAWGLAASKVPAHLIENHPHLDEWIGSARRRVLMDKAQLPPLRIAHFTAVAYLVSLAAPKLRVACLHPLAWPLVICGRHSLVVYCVGTLLAYLAAVAFHCCGRSFASVLIIGLDFLIVQFVIAALIDRTVRGHKSSDQNCYHTVRVP